MHHQPTAAFADLRYNASERTCRSLRSHSKPDWKGASNLLRQADKYFKAQHDLLSKIRYLNEPYCSPESLTAKQEAFKDFTIYICIYKLVRAVKGRPCSFGQTGETKAKGYNEHPSEIWDIHLMIVRLVWRSSGGQDGMP
ncbi:hypothetical protein D918_00746 [Trichuris suis]|nr:hypothetical protein D918_00746 [Trichuris suis]